MGFSHTMMRLALIGIIGLLVSFKAAAEQKIQVGEFEIHYTAFPSPQLVELDDLVGGVAGQQDVVAGLDLPGEPHEEQGVDAHG